MAAKTDENLEQIKARMTEKQRADMAEIIGNEIKRREAEKTKAPKPRLATKSNVSNSSLSSALGADEVGQMYADTDANIRQLRLKKLEEQLSTIRGQKQAARLPLSMPKIKSPFSGQGTSHSKQVYLLYLLLAVGVIKILFSSGIVNASVPKQDSKSDESYSALSSKASAIKAAPLAKEITDDQELVKFLDSRRVELAEREQVLDKKEKDLRAQEQAISEKMADLKGLTAKLASYRTEKDQKHETRLEQLAEVYGSMAPNQAAPLIAKLDNATALSLLQRMTGKRMGQILSEMPSDRAIELTKSLTDRSQI
ncbi:MAG: hypothetical protein IT292_09535 [Deltaproteobacteria bacterium]|nr:hypothetical protein [Deltaproteobacteria bacterium]